MLDKKPKFTENDNHFQTDKKNMTHDKRNKKFLVKSMHNHILFICEILTHTKNGQINMCCKTNIHNMIFSQFIFLSF